jgi:hypothetical protein
MGLTFLQPAFLLGALAASVPLVIHLINRQRALVQRFPAIRFLLLADKRTARKFRVHQWLLLALRMAAICLLAFALAQPRLVGSTANAALTLPPQATVLLIDNSLSMQYTDGSEPRLPRAKALTQRILHSLAPQDSALVMPLLSPSQDTAEPMRLSQDQALWQAQLDAIQPSHAAVDLTSALQRAFTLLQESPAPRRRLVFLSDLTVSDWEGFHLSRLPVVPDQVTLHFLRLGSPERDANMALTEVRITEKPFIAHTPLNVTVRVRNASAVPQRNVRVDLLLGAESIGQQLADLGPDEEVTVPFRIAAPPAGLHWGEVRLSGDAFAEDDRLFYAVRTSAPARVLVVDGDPGTSLLDSDIFYLLSALQPRGVLGYPLFYPKPITWEGLEQESLRDYQVIILCNVEALAAPIRQRLHQFVLEGGGVVFFAGNRIDATRYNAMFYGSDTVLLPLALGQPVQQPQEQPLTLAPIANVHEALSVFAGQQELLQRGKFYRYMAVEGLGITPGARALLSFSNGHPLLIEKGLGRGRVLFFTSSADRDWTDLPSRTAYVPLLHGLVAYAAQLSAATQRPEVFLPAPARLSGRAEDVGATLTIHTPDGHERLSRYAADGEQSVVAIEDLAVPGIYRLLTPVGDDLLTVQATRAESNFLKLQLADLQTRFQPLSIVLEEEALLGHSTASTALPAQELAGFLLLTLIVVLVVENLCANRF